MRDPSANGNGTAGAPGHKLAAMTAGKKGGNASPVPGKRSSVGKQKAVYDPRRDDPLLLNNKKKKNRLGQHARQKLAEEKFGAQAKHLREQQHVRGFRLVHRLSTQHNASEPSHLSLLSRVVKTKRMLRLCIPHGLPNARREGPYWLRRPCLPRRSSLMKVLTTDQRAVVMLQHKTGTQATTPLEATRGPEKGAE